MLTGKDPPTGTVSLLFTDIEGSTRLLRRLGEGYGDVLAEHQRLLREAWAQHKGTEIDTQGDSFFVAFTRASDAVAAAAHGQRLISMKAWPGESVLRVRMGIHTGEPSLMAGNYVGIDVHRAARIAAAGHGGQVLISQTTVDLLPPQLPGGLNLRDLGEYQLKDLAVPEHLFQLVMPELQNDFPELMAILPARTNLPIMPTPLVGRAHELQELRSLLDRDDVRLLTLTGPGGTGKTRLATALAAEAVNDFADGVFLIDLGTIVDPGLVLSEIAANLPLGERPGEPLADWLVTRLQARDMLIILDNFEHVMTAAPAAANVLARTPGIKLIVTSRESLRVAAEHEYPVPPLDLPDSVDQDLDALAGCPSVRLLLDRAKTVRADFRLTSENAKAVAEICTRLDGLPLAIELAAPWLRVLQPQALLDRLGQRLDLLTDGARDLPERQRTLRGAIDWSYRLLDENERVLFSRLGIFVGGWTLEAAESVCASPASATELLLVLGSLIEKNLVRRESDSGGEPRFSMLESIRKFALERLEATGARGEVSVRHAEVFLALAEQAEPGLFGSRQSAWMQRLDDDLDNLRAAMGWAVETPDGAELGLRLNGALTMFWFFSGQYREGLYRSIQALDADPEAEASLRAKGLLGAGLLGVLLGDHTRAKNWLEEGLALGRKLGNDSLAARCLDWLGLLAFFRDDISTARRLLEESVVKAREADDLWCLADALGTLGSILPLQGALAAAEEVSDEALEIARRAGDQQGARMALFGRALAAVRSGELARARLTAEEGLAICRSMGDVWFISYFLWLLATCAVEGGDLETARRHADESLDMARRIDGRLLIVCALGASAAVARARGDQYEAVARLEEAQSTAAGGGVPTSYVSAVVKGLGELAAEQGDSEAAKRLLEAAEDMARSVGDRWATASAMLGLADLASATEITIAKDLMVEALELQVEMGAQLEIAKTLEVYAWAAAARGEFQPAAELLAAADGLLIHAGAVRPAWRGGRCEEIRRDSRAHLGKEDFAAATAAGSAATLEQAARRALAWTASEG